MALPKKRFLLILISGVLNLCTSARAAVEDSEPELPPAHQQQNRVYGDLRPKLTGVKRASR